MLKLGSSNHSGVDGNSLRVWPLRVTHEVEDFRMSGHVDTCMYNVKHTRECRSRQQLHLSVLISFCGGCDFGKGVGLTQMSFKCLRPVQALS